MDRCMRSFSAFVLLFHILVSSVVVAKAEEKVKGSPPPVPVPAPKTGTLSTTRNSLNQTRNPDGSPTNSSAVKAPPPVPMSWNSTISPPLPSLNGTSKPPPPPNATVSLPKRSPVEPSPSSGNGPPINTTRSGEEGKKNGGNVPSGSNASSSGVQKCGAANTTCWDSLVACLWHPPNDSKKRFLIIHNEGEDALTVIILIHPDRKIDKKTITKKSPGKIPIPVAADATDNLEIVLKNGDKICHVIRKAPIPGPNFFQQLPTYATQMTPIYGAYVIFLTALIVGGMWVCCKFARWGRRADGGLPYQQLEMGVLTQSTSAVETDAAHGWDQWDDDWDEEEAVSRPSQKQHSGDVLANGQTTTTSNKDGWEDWDD